ncbi:MAG: twin-arginine translocase TatA/TatE family subunit [Chloroflexi bacterium]|nr:twin-arginine translocase TatA/TatE family subunit [Chloroflexota bacterium]
MIGDLGAPELLIILALVVLLFGVGKLGRLGKDLGSGVKEFRRAIKDDEEPASRVSPVENVPEAPKSRPGDGPAIF